MAAIFGQSRRNHRIRISGIEPRIRMNRRHPSEFDPIALNPIPQCPIPEDLSKVLKENVKTYPGISSESLEWLNTLEKLSKVEFIQNENYLATLKVLLYLEEFYSEKSPDQFIKTTINRAKFSLDLNQFDIKIPPKMLTKNLQEYLMPDDVIEVQTVGNPRKYKLFVTKVEPPFVAVKSKFEFQNVYRVGGEYMVKFLSGNWPIRAQHYAISLLNKSKLCPLLCPVPSKVCGQPIVVFSWFNNNIRRNPEQMQAVQRILGQTAQPSPYLVFGPPGTGKTATIVEAISQISKTLKKKILVCTLSNAAADEITKRLLPNVGNDIICRLNSQSRDRKNIDKSIHGCSYDILSMHLFRTKEIFVMTLVTCTRLVRTSLFTNHFSYIFIDEAGQATQPEMLIPLGLTKPYEYEGYLGRLNAQLVLSGDPKQLGPVVMTKIGQHLLGESMLERLMNRVQIYQRDEDGKYNPNFLTKLVKNYRSHEAILRLPNKLFYENELVSCGGKEIFRAENWSKLPKKQFPIIFHAIHGIEKRSRGSPSVHNQREVAIVVNYVSKLLGEKMGKHKIKETDIGIVSPFSSQGENIKNALERKGWHEISVGTVEIFQGQEKSIIIVSTVRSALFQHDGKFHIGFLSHEKRFNVTITRAKSLLIVVGNPKFLQIDPNWLEFIKYCQQNRACLGQKFTLRELSEDDKLKMTDKKPGKSLTFEDMFKRLDISDSD